MYPVISGYIKTAKKTHRTFSLGIKKSAPNALIPFILTLHRSDNLLRE